MRGNLLSRFRFVLPGVAVLATLAAVGCNSNSAPMATTPTITPTPTPTATPALTTTPTPSPYTINIVSKAIIGNYLVDNRGMTLYYTVSDRPGYSNLPDETLLVWPVFYVPNNIVPPSLNTSDFGPYTRDNNVRQTTYKGYPLYYFSQDKLPGDTLGNKAGGVWFVVNPDSFPP